jgi:hypothetical protein
VREILLSSIALLGLASPAWAGNVHLFCDSPAVCTDDNHGASQFITGGTGFTVDHAGGAITGSATESLTLAFVVPTNIPGAGAEAITINGISAGLIGTWTSGTDLGTLIFGTKVKTNDPFGNYTANDPSDTFGTPTAFDVYTATFTDISLSNESAGAGGSAQFTDSGAPVGEFVIGFLDQNGSVVGTPSSETLLISTRAVITDAPEPATLAVLGVGLLGLGVVRRRIR